MWHHCMHVHTYVGCSNFTIVCPRLFQSIILLYEHTHYACDYCMYMKCVPFKDE